MDQSVLEAFLRCAERYCAWFERIPTARAGESERDLQWREALKARVLVAELYACGARLDESGRFGQDREHGGEDSALRDVGSIELVYVPGEVARGDEDVLAQRLRRMPFQYYVEPVVDGFELQLDGAQCLGDLCDDLHDIWVDMRRGLEEWRAGRPLEALAEWNLLFACHWGPHAVGALKALHEFILSGGLLEGDRDRG
jgi:hypothetical protein